MKKINNSYPELKGANAVEEVAMLANFPGETSETPDFTDLAQKAYESFINYFKAIFKMKSQLPQVDVKTIYAASNTNQSEPETLPPSVIPGLTEAAVLPNNQWDESTPPRLCNLQQRKILQGKRSCPPRRHSGPYSRSINLSLP